MKRFAFSAAIYLLWFAAVFDPVGNLFQLRYIALASVLACVGIGAIFNSYARINLNCGTALVLCLSIFMPLYGLALYSLKGGSTNFVDTSYIASGVLILSTLVYEDPEYCKIGIRAMVFALRLLTVIIISIYVFIFRDIDYEWVSFFTEGGTALISTRTYADIVLPYIYFLASPMLIFLIGYDMHRFVEKRSLMRLGNCAATIFAFALSGTRAHIIIAILFLPIYYVLNVPRKKLYTILVISIVFALIAAYYSPDLIAAFFSTKEDSNELKLQLLDMYAEAFSEPLSFLLGQGYNAHEWFSPLREKLAGIENASKTELTYLELIRVYGFLVSAGFFLLLALLIQRVARLKSEHRWLYPAFVIFMVNTALNPYLFSTNGMLPLALIIAVTSLRPGSRKSDQPGKVDIRQPTNFPARSQIFKQGRA